MAAVHGFESARELRPLSPGHRIPKLQIYDGKTDGLVYRHRVPEIGRGYAVELVSNHLHNIPTLPKD